MTITDTPTEAPAHGAPQAPPEAAACTHPACGCVDDSTCQYGARLVLAGDEAAELLAFVRKAAPLLDELGEHLPKLRALAPLLAQVSQGGPAGLLGLLGAAMRGS
jgi:hypothetical protein